MKTTENNKLIAEFMQLEKVAKDFFNEHNPREYYVRQYNGGEWYLLEELQYHKSWDWLMPVVKKVMQKDYEFLVFEELKYKWWKADIDAVYSAVVEFIKEYDNN